MPARGRTELTTEMCEFDANWIDVIDPRAHGFRFQRTTTIGLGGSHCPFHFDRT
ncbi:L-2-amino-thiazoline-4-carboxylic acid hydrolase [Nocardia sp. CA-129566]|uniref:L-2-amino-thiazoline-4-carboxylic acid hydrolase n=1 Tax=Nocardia sp. CA-129566 TaxID=3239976 RepID=UPI003D96DE1A